MVAFLAARPGPGNDTCPQSSASTCGAIQSNMASRGGSTGSLMVWSTGATTTLGVVGKRRRDRRLSAGWTGSWARCPPTPSCWPSPPDCISTDLALPRPPRDPARRRPRRPPPAGRPVGLVPELTGFPHRTLGIVRNGWRNRLATRLPANAIGAIASFQCRRASAAVRSWSPSIASEEPFEVQSSLGLWACRGPEAAGPRRTCRSDDPRMRYPRELLIVSTRSYVERRTGTGTSRPSHRPGELTRDALSLVARGPDSVMFFQWRQSTVGSEQSTRRCRRTQLPRRRSDGRSSR